MPCTCGAGYEHPVDQVVEDLLSCLDDPALALLQWNEAFGVVQVRRGIEPGILRTGALPCWIRTMCPVMAGVSQCLGALVPSLALKSHSLATHTFAL